MYDLQHERHISAVAFCQPCSPAWTGCAGYLALQTHPLHSSSQTALHRRLSQKFLLSITPQSPTGRLLPRSPRFLLRPRLRAVLDLLQPLCLSIRKTNRNSSFLHSQPPAQHRMTSQVPTPHPSDQFWNLPWRMLPWPHLNGRRRCPSRPSLTYRCRILLGNQIPDGNGTQAISLLEMSFSWVLWLVTQW